MHPSITPLAAILRLNTELVLNCIEDLDEERGLERGDPPVNSITFLVAHLTETRHFLARLHGAAPGLSILPSLQQGALAG